MDEEFMLLAIKQARKALSDGEKIPFGAVITKNDEVISVAHNSPKKNNDPTAHAEVNAIRLACKKLGNSDLTDCTLYSTCEPCTMCFGAAWWARIPKIVYGVKIKDITRTGKRQINIDCEYLNNKGSYKLEIKGGILKDKCMELYT